MPDRALGRAPRVLVAGGGLAGLAAACTALEHGADVTLVEAREQLGGATADSAGWIWRYVDRAVARAGAPMADPLTRDLVVDRLDDELDWLEAQGVPVLAKGTGRALTRGVRIDPRVAIESLAARVGRERITTSAELRRIDRTERGGIEVELELGDDARRRVRRVVDAVVVAGGGYAGDIERIADELGLPAEAAAGWRLRARSPGRGTALGALVRFGARRPVVDGQCLVRVAPCTPRPVPPEMLVAASELHLPVAVLRDPRGEVVPRAETDWSGAEQLSAWLLRGGTGTLELPATALSLRVHSGSVASILELLSASGCSVEQRSDGSVRLEVCAGITHTWCGVAVDADACVRLPGDAEPAPVFAAGCDAAGTGLGGTASGLAQALVLGRRAGHSVATILGAATSPS